MLDQHLSLNCYEEVQSEQCDSFQIGGLICESGAVYTPRHAEESILYGVVAENLETFLARQQQRERVVPRFVERELRSFLECGILAHGFIRVHCDACGRDRIVPYSCKGRGFCGSCCGRRMADTAAHLVDRVLPEVPIRQWVLSLPYTLRYRMAYDSQLVGDIHHIFIQTVFGSLRRRAGGAGSGKKPKCGAVTFIQRFGDALNINVHFHLLAMDGVYAEDDKGRISFHSVSPPSDKEVVRVAERIARRIETLMIRHGFAPQCDPSEEDPLRNTQPLLAELYGASISGRIATGPRAGRRVARVGDTLDLEAFDVVSSPRCANVSGVNVHANVGIPADALFVGRFVNPGTRPISKPLQL